MEPTTLTNSTTSVQAPVPVAVPTQTPTLVVPTQIAVAEVTEKPKMRIWLKVILWMIASPFLLVFSYIVFIVIFSLVSKDDMTINDGDLQLAKVEIPNEENGYLDLEKIKNRDKA